MKKLKKSNSNLVKREPERTCLACRTAKNKKELVRVVKNKENEMFVDETGKKSGRGAYICKSRECLETALKQKRLENSFKMQISEDVKKELQRQMEEMIGYE